MDHSESQAKAALIRMGYSSIVFEPDGNVPPDFVVDGRIAVEVRRLNQNRFDGDKPKGLEEDAFPLHYRMERLFASFGPAINGVNWYVSYSFKRPIPDWKVLEPEVLDVLKAVKADPVHAAIPHHLSNGFRLSFYSGGDPLADLFQLGGMSDHDEGGWVVSNLIENVSYCIASKAEKIEPYRHKYDEWWLVLVDQISYCSLDNWNALGENLHSIAPWTRVIGVSPIDAERFCELVPK